MSSGYTYAQARLAVDEYNENKKKMDYTNEIVDLWNAALEEAEEDSLKAGLLGFLVGAFTGDMEDAQLGWDIGTEIGYHGSWEFGDGNDIVDNMLDYEATIGDVKFNQSEFEDGLYELHDDMVDDIDDKRVASIFGIMGDIKSFGELGGFDTGGPRTSDMGMFERFGYNIKSYFGAEGLTVPEEFENEQDWLTHIMNELDAGKSLDLILTPSQQRELFGTSSQGINIEQLFKDRQRSLLKDEDED